MTCSVIIPSHNGRHWLERCLPRVSAGSAAECDVVVVDNGSSDGTAAWLAEHWPDVTCLQVDEPLGYAAACNHGAAYARGTWLVVLNNDTEPAPGWLDALVATAAAADATSLVTARVVHLHDRETVDSAGDGYAWWGAAFKHGHGQPAGSYDAPATVFGACGAAFCIAREFFRAIGGFDPRFGSVYEDVDLSMRARLAGGQCLYEPAAIVYHAGSATLGVQSATAIRLGQRNLEWTWLGNLPWSLLIVTALPHLLYEVVAGAWFLRIGRFGAFLMAKVDAARGLPHVLRKRREAGHLRRTSAASLLGAMTAPPLLGKWVEKRFTQRRA